MALSREQKEVIVAEVVELLQSAKLIAIAQYKDVSVKDLQKLRRNASEQGTTVKVVKNRLLRLAASRIDALKDTDLSAFTGQLLYATNADDEVAPAQVLARFAKEQPALQMVGGISNDGTLLSADDMKMLASLPSKDQLRAQLVGTINAPLSGFVNVLAGNVRGVLNVLNSRADALGNS